MEMKKLFFLAFLILTSCSKRSDFNLTASSDIDDGVKLIAASPNTSVNELELLEITGQPIDIASMIGIPKPS